MKLIKAVIIATFKVVFKFEKKPCLNFFPRLSNFLENQRENYKVFTLYL